MTTRATHRQADLARALRAARKDAGNWQVELMPSGAICFVPAEHDDLCATDAADELIDQALSDFIPPEIPDNDDRECSVYFIKCRDDVKIGISKHVPSRASDIQVGQSEKVEILHTLKGGRRLESHFHKTFSALHIRGEWFRYDGELRDWIEEQTRAAL